MLINIDPSTGTVTRLDGQEESGLLKTCDRLKEELGGWLDTAADDPAALRQAVVRGRRWLTGVTGRLPMAFAYAPGPHAEALAQAAQEAHYRLALTEGTGRPQPFAKAPFAVTCRRIPAGLRPWQAYLLATRGRYRW